jgi:excisionase family DNA binding protein
METQTVEKRYLSYREAMTYTGLGRTLLTQLVTSGSIPAARVNRRVLIDREALDNWISKQSYVGVKE